MVLPIALPASELATGICQIQSTYEARHQHVLQLLELQKLPYQVLSVLFNLVDL